MNQNMINADTLQHSKEKLENRRALYNKYATMLDSARSMAAILSEKKNNMFATDTQMPFVEYELAKIEIEIIELTDRLKFMLQEIKVYEERIPQLEEIEREYSAQLSLEANRNYANYIELAKTAATSEDAIGSLFKEVLADIDSLGDKIKEQEWKNKAYNMLKQNLIAQKIIK